MGGVLSAVVLRSGDGEGVQLDDVEASSCSLSSTACVPAIQICPSSSVSNNALSLSMLHTLWLSCCSLATSNGSLACQPLQLDECAMATTHASPGSHLQAL